MDYLLASLPLIRSRQIRMVVAMQLGINDGWTFGGLRRTPETSTPTRLESS